MNKPFKSDNPEINKLVDWIASNFQPNTGDIRADGYLYIGNNWRLRESDDGTSLYLDLLQGGLWINNAEWYL